MDGDITTRRGLIIPAGSVSWRFSRGTGPGGQGVNTTDSRVELIVDLTALVAAEEVRERIMAALGESVRVVAAAERSQLRNREAAVERLVDRLDALARAHPRRRPTRRTRASVEDRLQGKRRRSEVKSARRVSDADHS